MLSASMGIHAQFPSAARLLAVAMGCSCAWAQTVPVLRYQAPPDFQRSAIFPPEDYSSTQFNGSFQIYPFEPFSGNLGQQFGRTLLRERIDPQHREENVVGQPKFGTLNIPGAQGAFYAEFIESPVGIARPHLRIVIVAGGQAAIFDARAITPELWQRLQPALKFVLGTLRVEAAPAPPSLTDAAGPAERAVAGLYRGIKAKYMTGLTFQSSYFTNAPHFYLFSDTGRAYSAYDQIRAPGGDPARFDFDSAQRADPTNSGLFRIRDGQLYLKMGTRPLVVTAAPASDMVTIDSVTYTRIAPAR